VGNIVLAVSRRKRLSRRTASGQKRPYEAELYKDADESHLGKTDQVRWFTNMLDAAKIAPQGYDWYVSGIETN